MAFNFPVEIKGWLLYPPEEASLGLCAIMIFLVWLMRLCLCACVCVCFGRRKKAVLTLYTSLDAYFQYDPLTLSVTVEYGFRCGSSYSPLLDIDLFCPRYLSACVVDDFKLTIERRKEQSSAPT